MNRKGAKLAPKLKLNMPFAEALFRLSIITPESRPLRQGIIIKRKTRTKRR